MVVRAAPTYTFRSLYRRASKTMNDSVAETRTSRGGRRGNVIPGVLVRCNGWRWWGAAIGEDGTTRVLVGEIA